MRPARVAKAHSSKTSRTASVDSPACAAAASAGLPFACHGKSAGHGAHRSRRDMPPNPARALYGIVSGLTSTSTVTQPTLPSGPLAFIR